MKRDMTDDDLDSAIAKARLELAQAEIAKAEAETKLLKLWYELKLREKSTQDFRYRYEPAGGPRGE